MNDLDITRLCAEAMGIHIKYGAKIMLHTDAGTVLYDPLHNDAQAMALVKKIRLSIGDPSVSTSGENWCVDGPGCISADNPDLNRAICTCVAHMQKAIRDAGAGEG